MARSLSDLDKAIPRKSKRARQTKGQRPAPRVFGHKTYHLHLLDDDELDRLQGLVEGLTIDRAGNPLAEIYGLGIGLSDHPEEHAILDYWPDLVALAREWRAECGGGSPDSLKVNNVKPRNVDAIFPVDIDKERTRRKVSNDDLTTRELRQDAYLTAIEGGWTQAEARDLAGVTDVAVRQWRHRDPEFRARSTTAIQVRQRRNRSANPDDFDPVTVSPPEVDDFVAMRRYYFGYETYAHHLEIISVIEKTQPGQLGMILTPVGSAKTKLLTDYICIEFAKSQLATFLYMSEAGPPDGVCGKVLYEVKQRLTDPNYVDPKAQYPTRIGEFIARFGGDGFRVPEEDTDKRWSNRMITLHGAPGTKDPSLEAVGISSRFFGARAGRILLDDVQSAESLDQTDKIMNRISQTLFTRMEIGEGSPLIFVGTPAGLDDVVSRLIEEGRVDHLIEIPALDENDQSYCPEMYTTEQLVGSKYPNEIGGRRKKVGESTWWCSYMLDPKQSGAVTFSEEVRDKAKDLGREFEPLVKPKGIEWGLSMSVDPSLANFNAISVCAYTRTLFVPIYCQIDKGLARNEAILEQLGLVARRFQPTDLIVEVTGTQRGIARDERLRILSRDCGFNIVEYETGSNKRDAHFGIAAMAGSMLRGEFAIPWRYKDPNALASDPEPDNSNMRQLDREMERWRPGADPKRVIMDLLMSIWFQWAWWRDMVGALEHDPEQFRDEALPWEPDDMSGSWQIDEETGLHAFSGTSTLWTPGSSVYN